MKIRPFRAVIPKMNFVASPHTFFKSVREKYPEYKEGNFFKKASQEAIYIYNIKKEKSTHTGIITCTHIKEFISNRIKKHENTLKAKEQQQIDLMLLRSAVVKPILVFYPEEKKINTAIQQHQKANDPFFEIKIEESGEVHTIWEVKDGAEVEHFVQLFHDQVPEAYIADGHHRSASAARMYLQHKEEKMKDNPYDYLMSAYFPSSQLDIWEFNRIIDLSKDFSPTRFLANLTKLFDIEYMFKPIKPKKKFQLSMYMNGEWYKMSWKKDLLKKYGKNKVVLDANLLNEHVLHDIIGITDVRTDERISYSEGIHGIQDFVKRVEKREGQVGFILYPVDIEDLIGIADKNKIMPPKSTWFEPRMKNGILVQEH